jgi:hypothetical protein
LPKVAKSCQNLSKSCQKVVKKVVKKLPKLSKSCESKIVDHVLFLNKVWGGPSANYFVVSRRQITNPLLRIEKKDETYTFSYIVK